MISFNEEINFIKSDKGIELQTLPLSDDQSSLCLLYYEEKKKLWSIIPYCIDFWIITSCKIPFDNFLY